MSGGGKHGGGGRTGAGPDGGAEPDGAGGGTGVDTSLIDAFGGVRGMVDMTVPGFAFVVVFTVTKNLGLSSYSAFGLTLLLAVVRLARRETLKHAFGGVLGVAISAYIAMKSGKAQDFYLPSMIYGVALGIAYAISAVVRWPLIGVFLGPILGENMTWRTQNPGRLAAYTKATWVWVALFALRAAILFPLYWAGNVTWLGVAKIGLGVPPWLVAIYLSWLILSKAPPPIKVAQEEAPESASDAEPETSVEDLVDWPEQLPEQTPDHAPDHAPERR
ncbi:DUF3159 domain-containing protein [Streptacidiphilus albus]|uniref:DUF3159 domain-containing protein n=1 Tax=Streptacidiphilus albus TaxID=105425 RepID=UPI0007C70304|nr:DUF3159 domain-containing protein [Streptacidiphilus albus]